MAFWTSNEPGVLPKWIFWLFSATAVISLISLGILPSSQISTEHIAAFLASALTAGLARINAVKILVGINAVACLFIVAGTLVVVLAVDRQSKGGSVVSAIMVGYTALSVWWVWYLNLYRVKPIPTANVSRPPTDSHSVAGSHSAPRPNDSGSASSEKQLAERGIFDIEHGGTPEEASPDDYAMELSLFEAGDLDQSLWAKHLVEAEGDVEKAKWKYLKERVGTAPVRRAEQHKAERKATEEAERRRREEEEAKQVAAEEAERKAAEEVEQKRAYRAAQANLQRLRDERAEKIGCALPVILVIAVLIVMLLTSI